MKKVISAAMAVLMVFTTLTVSASAAENTETTETSVEYFEDGSYIVTTITEEVTYARSSKSITKTSAANYYDSSTNLDWTVRLTASFTYTGSSATCTSASKSYTIYDDSWKVTSSSATKSGNKATGNFTVKKYTLGIPVKTVSKTLTLTCSASGTVS